ncbi:MAG: lipopolysaccharide transport periplasmic protein LptA [Gammaproteobacteria bacterium]|nr:MAG: lipopolysaccharide transport periplasmic protein LptA [Gammaproteobacteria bacterium]
MSEANMNRKYIYILALCLFSQTAYSLSTDKNKPLSIEADSVEMDEKRGFTVYRGNVIVDQGTMHVTGNTLVIERVGGKVKKVTIVGKPATYRQRPDGKKTDVNASARKLQVEPEKDLVTLERNAKIVQEGNVFTGNLIEYDNKQDIVKAKGSVGATDTGPKQGGRVRMTIQPNK